MVFPGAILGWGLGQSPQSDMRKVCRLCLLPLQVVLEPLGSGLHLCVHVCYSSCDIHVRVTTSGAGLSQNLLRDSGGSCPHPRSYEEEQREFPRPDSARRGGKGRLGMSFGERADGGRGGR